MPRPRSGQASGEESGPASGHREPDPRNARRSGTLLAISAGTLSALVFLACRHALIDDSYITLGFVREVALHGHWGLISSRVSNTATSPLNVLVLAAITLAVRDPVTAAGVAQVGAAAGTAVLLGRVLAARGLPRWPALVAVVVTVLNPIVVSSTGLESALAVALIAALLTATVAGRAAGFGALAALLVLTRGDLVVLPVVLAVGSPALWPRWRRLLGAAAAVLLPWSAWSWWFLGSAVPDTLLIKMDFGGWPKLGRDWFFADGLVLYLRMYPLATTISLISVVAGLVLLAGFGVRRLMRRMSALTAVPVSPFALLALAGVVHWGVFSLLGVAPYHWYYAPLIATLGIWSSACVAAAWRRRPLPAVGLAAGFAAPVLVFLAAQGTCWQVMPITTNWGLPGQYRAIGRAVGRTVGDAGVATPGEVGTIAYYCDCQISDSFSDRALVLPMIEQARFGDSLAARLWRLNYARAPHRLAPVPTVYQMSTSPTAAGHAAAWPVFSPWNPGVVAFITMDGPLR